MMSPTIHLCMLGMILWFLSIYNWCTQIVHVSIMCTTFKATAMSRIWYVCTSMELQRWAKVSRMHAYSVNVLPSLWLKNRIIVNALVRWFANCKYIYTCTKVHISQLFVRFTAVQNRDEARERNQLHTKALTWHLCSIMEFLPLSHWSQIWVCIATD